MKTYYQTLLLLPAFLFISLSFSVAQDTKQEVEKSINRDEMPANALSLLKPFWNEQKKADFYRESDGKAVSFEVKFNRNGYLYSIEFDENGALLDIEQLITFEEISETAKTALSGYLNDQYTKFRITRIQRQFTAENPDMKSQNVLYKVFDEDFSNLIIRYELEVEAQNKTELGVFEFLFNENGELIRKREIVRRSLDNIW